MKSASNKHILRILVFLIVISLIIPPMNVLANTITSGISGGTAWTLSNDVLTISPASEPEQGYDIGVMRTDYNGTSIPVPWSSNVATITSLNVTDGVTTLAYGLFNNGTNLSSISFPDGLTSIGDRCFSNCTSLTSLELPNSITAIGDIVFNGCTGLTEIDISNTQITALGKKAFAACSGLTTITLPKLTSIGQMCFGSSSGVETNNLSRINYAGTSSDWNNMTISTSGNGASTQTNNTQLLNCIVYCTDGIYSLNSSYNTVSYTPSGYTIIPNTSIAWKIANGTLFLLGYGPIPDFTEGSAPWYNVANSINAVDIDKYINSIGQNAFFGCQELAYSYDGEFTELEENSSFVGNTALFGNGNGSDEGDNNMSGTSGSVTYSFNQTSCVMTLSGIGETASYNLLDDLNNDTVWSDLLSQTKEVVVEEGITALGKFLFAYADQLEKITLPSSLVSIGPRCFTNCYALEEVVFTSNVDTLALTTMGEVAFNCCTSLTSIDLSRTALTNLPRKAFAACPSLTTVSIPSTVTSITNDCFGSTGIDGVTTCTNQLMELHYGGTLNNWNNGSFVNNTGNTNLTNGTCTVYCTDGLWASGYQSSGNNLCYKIADGELTIRCIGEMPEYAEQSTPWYSSASDITSVVLTEGITRISANAFEGCSNLINIELPQSVTSIGTNAFTDCSLLESVDYLGTISQWNTLEESIANGNDPLLGATLNSAYSGACGDNATWSYDENTKTLTIAGSGPMWDWNSGTFTNTPWYKFKNEIETIAFEEGITATGRYAFLYMEALTEIQLSSTIEIIGGFSFGWNSTLETLVLPEGVRFISGRAFSRVDNLKTIYFPSTIESIDMYAFIFGSGYGPISDVYYNGTEEDWANVYLSSQGDNAYNLLPDTDTTWHYLKEYEYFGDISETAWYFNAAYYLKDNKMVPSANSFGINETADTEWVLDILYARAGSPGFYTDSLDWAKENGIVSESIENDDSLSLSTLSEILYHTALFNGHAINLETSTALTWCTTQGYTSDYAINAPDQSADTVLTRADAASIIVAYLTSPFGSADRYDIMRSQMKTAYKAGGDGKMYILALHHAGTGKVGDSTLILMPGGQLMLIDTFRSDGWTNYLKETFDYLEVTNLDYLVLSHAHTDHDYNLSRVVNYIYDAGYTIGTYWSAGDLTSSREKSAISLMESKGITIEKKIRAGEQRTIGTGSNFPVIVDFLWPTSAGASGDDNNKSLTMKLTYGESSYLTGGDLFMDGELAIIELYHDNLQFLEADVIKTNHHGSYSSNCREWVSVVDPTILITHSDDNGDSALNYQYSLDGREWYSAGRDGGILVVMDSNENITVTTGYDSNLRKDVIS